MSQLPQRGVVRLRTVLTAACTVAVLGFVSWCIFGQSEPTPWNKPATIDDATLRLTYTGSECRDSADVDVDEDSTKVVITVHETVRSMSCSDVGVSYDLEVRLNAPLADRELVDGACRMSKYANYVECGTNKATVKRNPS